MIEFLKYAFCGTIPVYACSPPLLLRYARNNGIFELRSKLALTYMLVSPRFSLDLVYVCQFLERFRFKSVQIKDALIVKPVGTMAIVPPNHRQIV